MLVSAQTFWPAAHPAPLLPPVLPAHPPCSVRSPNTPSRLRAGNGDKADTAPPSPAWALRWFGTQHLIAVHAAVLGAGPGMLALLTRRCQLLPVGGPQHREC